MIGNLLEKLKSLGMEEIIDHLRQEHPRKIRGWPSEHRCKHRFFVDGLHVKIGEATFPIVNIHSDGVAFIVEPPDLFKEGADLGEMEIALTPRLSIPGVARHLSPGSKPHSQVCGAEFDAAFRRELMVQLEVAIDWYLADHLAVPKGFTSFKKS